MNEALLELLDRLHALWPLRWLAVGAAWLICFAGWIVVLAIPNVYQSSAQVFVDTRTALKPILQGIGVEQDVNSEVSRVRQALLSRPALEEVARRTHLDAKVRGPQDMDDLIFALQRSLSIDVGQSTQGGGDNLYTIKYRSSDRDKSLAVVQSLLDSLIGDTLGGNQSGSDAAQKFLREQIQEYQSRLAATESQLAEFKQQNEGLIPGQKGDYFSRLSAEVDADQKARTDLSIAVSRRAELARQLTGATVFIPGTSSGSAESGTAPDLSFRLQESEAKLQDLLLRYTDKHPEVIALQDTIASLKQQEAEELAAISTGKPGSGAIRSLSANPVRQNIQLQLNQTDVEIAALRGAVAQHQLEITRLRTFVSTAPGVEQHLATLNRDYDVTKAQYSALVERLEKARVSESADRTGMVRFRVIGPPAADTDPVSPNRPLLIAGVLGAGLVGGFLLAFFVQQLRPVFSIAPALTQATGLPVLGTIGVVLSAEDRAARSRELTWLVGTCATLLVAGGLLFMSPQGAVGAVHSLLSMGAPG